jgi:hypothetical protein
MAVPNTYAPAVFSGNNTTTTAYPFTFPVTGADDVGVLLTASDGTQTTLTTADYTLTLTDAGASGGTLTTAIAYASTYTLTIYRQTAATQPTEWIDGDKFPAGAVEAAYDRATLLIQQLEEQTGRTFRLTEGETIAKLTPSDRRNKIPYFADTTAAAGTLLTPAQLLTLILLEVPTSVLDRPTTTFADAAGRAAAEADFTGQLGIQLDTLATDPLACLYVSQSTTAGDWERVTFNESSQAQAKAATDATTLLTPRRGRDLVNQVSLGGVPYIGFDRDDPIISFPTSTALTRYGSYLPGCEFHMRGDRSAGPTALSNTTTQTDTTTVNRIIDISGKGRHLERAGTGSTPPTYDSSSGAIEFPASCDAAFRLEGNERFFPADMTHNDHGLTVVIVAWADAATGGDLTERLFQLGTNSNALLTIGGNNDSGNGIQASVTTRKRAAESIISSQVYTTGEANKFLIALRIRDREMEMWYDGQSEGKKNPGNSSSVSLDIEYLKDCTLNLGAGNVGSGTPSNYWEGGICELAFFSRGLTNPELDWVVSDMALSHGIALRGQWHNNIVAKSTGLSVAEHTESAAYRPPGIYAIGVYHDETHASDGATPRRLLCEMGTNDPVSTAHYPTGSANPEGSVYNPKANLSSRYDVHMEGGGCIELAAGASLDAYAGLYTSGLSYANTTRGGGGTAPGGTFKGFMLRYQDEISGTVEDQGTGMWCSNTALRHSNGSIYRLHGEMYNQSVRISRVDPDGTITNVELAQNIIGNGTGIPGRAINDRYHLGIALVELNSGKIAAMWNSHFEGYLFLTTCSEDLGTVQTPQNLVTESTAQSSYIHVIHRTSNDDLHIFTRGTNNQTSPSTTEKGNLHLKVTGAENIGTTPATVTYDQVLLFNVGGAPRNNYMDTFRLHVDPASGKELIACVWNPLLNDVTAYGKMGAILDPDGNSGAGKWYFMDGEECSVNALGTMATPRFSLTELTELTGASPAGLIIYDGVSTDHNYRACQSPGSITRITSYGTAPTCEVFGIMTNVENKTAINAFDPATAFYFRYTPAGGGVKVADLHAFQSENYWSCGGVHQLDEEGNAIIAVAWAPKNGRYYTDIERADMTVYYEQGGPVIYVYKITNPFGDDPTVAEIGQAEPGGEFTTSLVSHVPGSTPGEVLFDVHAATNELHATHRQCKRLTLRVGTRPVRR